MLETVKPKQEPRLGPVALLQAEFKRTTYVATVERGLRPNDILNPAYWAFHAAKLKPWDHIEVRAEDGTWCGEYIVLESSRTWTRIHPLRVTYLTTQDISETQAAIENGKPETTPNGYEVKFRGPRKWSVIRKADSALLIDGLSQKGDADEWLAGHLSKQPEAVT